MDGLVRGYDDISDIHLCAIHTRVYQDLKRHLLSNPSNIIKKVKTEIRKKRSMRSS